MSFDFIRVDRPREADCSTKIAGRPFHEAARTWPDWRRDRARDGDFGFSGFDAEIFRLDAGKVHSHDKQTVVKGNVDMRVKSAARAEGRGQDAGGFKSACEYAEFKN